MQTHDQLSQELKAESGLAEKPPWMPRKNPTIVSELGRIADALERIAFVQESEMVSSLVSKRYSIRLDLECRGPLSDWLREEEILRSFPAGSTLHNTAQFIANFLSKEAGSLFGSLSEDTDAS